MNQFIPVAIAVGAGLAVFVLFMAVRAVFDVLRRLMARRDRLLADKLEAHLAAIAPPRSLGERIDRQFERMVGRSMLSLTGPQGAALVLMGGVTAGGAVYLWQPMEAAAAAASVVVMALLVGLFWLLHGRWQRSVQALLPDTFHLLARSLRAGLTVDQSLSLIGAQGQQPLAGEFNRCSEHLRLGMTVPAALEMTGSRIGLPDFDLLVSLVALHRDTGGNLPLLVDRLANTVRSRNHFRGHAVAVTALSRLTGAVLALAPPFLMGLYWLIYPDYIVRLTQTSQGLAALATALVLEVVGVLWMTWLLRIDY
jgi:tight adherence protein B